MSARSLAALFLLASASLFAQTGGVAGISGTVRDATGAAVPNAKVVISSASQGEVRSLTTNDAGAFSAPSLIPTLGYKVTVTAPGFNTYVADKLDLAVGQNLDLNIGLTVGTSTTQVDVTATAALVDDTKSDVSTVVDNKAIQELPVNGRRVDSFVLLTPGVSNDATFGLLTFRGIAGNNSFLLDGNDNTEQFYNENAGRTRIQSQVSQDAVQEFQVVSDNYSAEYGRALGGVVNTVTKSGTNQVHGSAFYYLRTTGFDAADPFATINQTNQSTGVTAATRINPPDRYVEWGGTVGGAIVKNKLFYFFSGDFTYRNFPIVDSYISANIINPITQQWVTTGSAACGSPATPAQCAAINNLLPRFFGLVPRTDHNDLAFGRLDYHASDKNTFTASFNYLRWKSPNGIQTGLDSTSGAGVNGNGDDSVFLKNGKLGWTWIPSSNFVNQFRFGVDTDRQADSFEQSDLGTGLGAMYLAVDGVQLGVADYLPRVEPSETRFEFSDDANYIKGNHSLKFGYSFFTTEDYNYYIAYANGYYKYANPTCFALDYTPVAGQAVDTTCSTGGTGKNWSSFEQAFGNPVQDYRISEMAWYVTDQWKVSSRFTINLGVRWDKSLSLTLPDPNPAYPQTGYLHTPSKNFAPRVGASYRLDDKTVLRGGFGLFYARLVGGLVDDLYTGSGIVQPTYNLSSSTAAQLAVGPSFPNLLAAPPSLGGASSLTLQFADPNIKTPYSAQGNITLQRQITSDMLLSVSGIFSRGIHLMSVVDLNLPTPSGSFTYTVNNASGTTTGQYTTPLYYGPRPNTAFGSVYEDTNGVDSVYDALAVTLNKRFSHGVQMLASYTWSHEIDDGQEQASNAIFFSGTSALYNGDNSAERASGWEDQRHRFVYSIVWAPQYKFSNPFANAVLANWQVATITTLASGRPYSSPSISVSSAPSSCSATVTTSCLPAGESLISTSYIDGYAGSSRVPFLPVNSILTPASYRADARITKFIPIKIKDRDTRLSLNFEVFNVSNSWSPTSMSSTEYTAAKGVLTLDPGAYGIGTASSGFPDGTQARRLQISARFTF